MAEKHKSMPEITVKAVVLDSDDIRLLSDFYRRFLGWEITTLEADWIEVRNPKGGILLAFQDNPKYVPPVWPETKDDQQQMLHLDFVVQDMDGAVKYALSCGARKAEVQYSDRFTVMLDPAGHPFCLVLKRYYDP